MRKSLYKINQDFVSVISEIEDNEGEIDDELAKKLEISEEDLKDKSFAYIQVIDEKESDDIRIKKEIDRLTAMRKKNRSEITMLEQSLLGSVTLFGEYNTGLYSIGVRKSQSVNILDEDMIPAQFKSIEEKVKVDKAAIKKALKDGKVSGAEISENKNLKIGNSN